MAGAAEEVIKSEDFVKTSALTKIIKSERLMSIDPNSFIDIAYHLSVFFQEGDPKITEIDHIYAKFDPTADTLTNKRNLASEVQRFYDNKKNRNFFTRYYQQ